jgi:threonine/homoserine/homoserine lactone efflux protein
MSFEHIIAFNIALVAAILSPGPAFLVAVRTTLSAGRRAGIAIGAGLGMMAATWTVMALLGLDVLFVLFPWAYAFTKTVGAIYLLYVAYRMWKDAGKAIDAQTKTPRHAFCQGLLINLLNPKSVIFAAAVLIVVFPAEMSATENGVIVLNHLVVELVFYTTLAFGMSTTAVSQKYLRAKVYIDRTASVILGSLGARLLASR